MTYTRFILCIAIVLGVLLHTTNAEDSRSTPVITSQPNTTSALNCCDAYLKEYVHPICALFYHGNSSSRHCIRCLSTGNSTLSDACTQYFGDLCAPYVGKTGNAYPFYECQYLPTLLHYIKCCATVRKIVLGKHFCGWLWTSKGTVALYIFIYAYLYTHICILWCIQGLHLLPYTLIMNSFIVWWLLL